MDDVAARTEGRVAAGGIELAYETFGQAGDPAIVLVMGWATQMIAWPDELCQSLAGRGHFVVRFDNRDTGGSTHLAHIPPPPLSEVLARRRQPPYTISDMADDVAGLLDGLGLDSVHLVGASMGGFIAQTVALRHPRRIRSLTLMMTSTGSLRVGLAIARAIPGCRFIGYPGMGHDLPRPLWPEFADQIATLAARGERDWPPRPVSG